MMKQRVQILTSDPSSRKIEGRLRDGGVVQIAAWEVGAGFRWPVPDEVWSVKQENNVWMLRSRIQNDFEFFPIDELSAGALRLDSEEIRDALGRSVVTIDDDTVTDGAVIIRDGYDWKTIHINAVTTTVADGSITNLKIASNAGIVYSKLQLTGGIVNADISSVAAIAYTKLNLVGRLVNTDISTTAAIAYSKLNLTGSLLIGDLSTSLTFNTLATSRPATASVTLSNQKLTNLADPTSAQDAATKAYVDGAITTTRAYVDSSIAALPANLKRYATTLGSVTASVPVSITHGLNTRDCVVSVYNTATFEDVEADIVRSTVNSISVTFAAAATSGTYSVSVIG